MKIGNIKLSSPLVLAPMAGVTDHAFRLQCSKYGAGLTCAEMINSTAVVRAFDTIKTFGVPLVIPDYFIEQLTITDERPVSIQLFGADAGEMAKSAHIIEQYADIIDINLGCPSPKLTGQEMGSKLLLYPERIKAIVSSVSTTCKKPVTVKMRLGYNKDDSLKIARICERAGAAAIAIHGRTTQQAYSGVADWKAIERVKRNISVPVIGNGDVNSPEIAKERLGVVDAVMIGRAARGNPFIFSRTLHYLKTGELLPEPTREERVKAFEEYVGFCDFRSSSGASRRERRNLADFKFQADYFMKGFKNSARLRADVHKAKSIDEVTSIIRQAA
ncbi:tRNA-dihydrouridine synthase [Candidatus Micrarchaeota archaeon]|nr:tRNA-dihydrouridine synthase [Candidatus Micrarchaeota archaeon]